MFKIGEYIPSDINKQSPDEVWDVYLKFDRDPVSLYHTVTFTEGQSSQHYIEDASASTCFFYTTDESVYKTKAYLYLDKNNGSDPFNISEDPYSWKYITSTDGNRYLYLAAIRPWPQDRVGFPWDMNNTSYAGASYTSTYLTDATINEPSPTGSSQQDTYPLIGIDYLENTYGAGGIDLGDPYIKFTSAGNITFKMSITGGSCWYSADRLTWTSVPNLTDVTCGTEVYIRGQITPSGSTACYFSTLDSTAGADIVCEGNIEALIDYTKISDNIHPVLYGKCFDGTFQGKKNLKSVCNLTLSAVTLSEYRNGVYYQDYPYCYSYMFSGCTNLIDLPIMPAAYLAHHCYEGMFSQCTSLINLQNYSIRGKMRYTEDTSSGSFVHTAYSCCEKMFYYCTQLVNLPSLPETTLAYDCYLSMFSGCQSLTTIPSNLLPATSLDVRCYKLMFSSCKGLQNISTLQLPATTLSQECYTSMFNECTSLENASFILPAAGMAKSCYSSMFFYCTSLTQAPTINATIAAEACFSSMFYGCRSLTTTNDLSRITLAQSCFYGMYGDCQSLVNITTLPQTTLTPGCYGNMFIGCTSLRTPPDLPATQLQPSCYSSMFSDCTSLETFPPSFNSVVGSAPGNCCYHMFANCSNLNGTPPELTATELDIGCYEYMFANCSSLTRTPSILPATQIPITAYYGMFSGCTSITQAPTILAERLIVGSNRLAKGGKQFASMFANCTSLQSFSSPLNIVANLTADQSVSAFSSMFYNCTNLATINSISITGVTGDGTCTSMFQNCSSLTSPINFSCTPLTNRCCKDTFNTCILLTTVSNLSLSTLTGSTGSQCEGMFQNCTSLATFPQNALSGLTTLQPYCYRYMFKDCKALKSTPTLPATTMTAGCYNEMFSGCNKLKTITTFTISNLANSCCSKMFNGCTSLTTVKNNVLLLATTGVSGCYSEMFNNCTSLIDTPEIMMTNAAFSDCMKYMFANCTSLQEPAILHCNNVGYTYGLDGMFKNCSNIKVSETRTGKYTIPYIIPVDSTTTTTVQIRTREDMFSGTGGTFTRTPYLNKTYYLYNYILPEFNLYVGVNGKAKRIEKIYVGVNGKAKEVTAMYVGVNGKAKKV